MIVTFQPGFSSRGLWAGLLGGGPWSGRPKADPSGGGSAVTRLRAGLPGMAWAPGSRVGSRLSGMAWAPEVRNAETPRPRREGLEARRAGRLSEAVQDPDSQRNEGRQGQPLSPRRGHHFHVPGSYHTPQVSEVLT